MRLLVYLLLFELVGTQLQRAMEITLQPILPRQE
jgi:hypothetical protein